MKFIKRIGSIFTHPNWYLLTPPVSFEPMSPPNKVPKS